MKKRFFTVLLTVFLSLTFLPLSACNKSGVPEETAQTTQASASAASQTETNTGATTSAGTDATPSETTIPGQETYKYSELFNLNPVEIDFKKAVKSGGVTVLDVPWGETEKTFAYPESNTGNAPATPRYVIADNGDIIVYDYVALALKTFRDGNFVSCVDLSELCGPDGNVLIYDLIWVDGSIIVAEASTRALYNITGDEFKRITAEGEFDYYWEMSSLTLFIKPETDYFCYGGGWFFFKDGTKREHDYGYFLDYRTVDGISYRINTRDSDDYTKHTVFLTDSDDVIHYAAFIKKNPAYTYNALGADSLGYVYYAVTSNYIRRTPSYLLRFDVVSQKADLIEITGAADYSNADETAYISIPALLPDGSVYIAVASKDSGVGIYSFRFN